MNKTHVAQKNRYNSNKAHQNEFNTVNMRASMESLLVDNKVAVVFNGHVHAYERSIPVAFNATTAKAPTYVDFAKPALLWFPQFGLVVGCSCATLSFLPFDVGTLLSVTVATVKVTPIHTHQRPRRGLRTAMPQTSDMVACAFRTRLTCNGSGTSTTPTSGWSRTLQPS